MLLYYFHDPMCSWCYAFDVALKQIETALTDTVELKKIVGGLAPDLTTAMPPSLINTIQSAWKQIETTVPHVQFNYDFWQKNQPRRSTYPSCRAVLAAKKQSPAFENKMIQQIQWAYYKNAENPSLDEILLLCAQRIGLDSVVFKFDYSSQAIEIELQNDIKFCRSIGVSSFPSLRLEIDRQIIPIAIDYNDAQNTLNQIRQYI